MFKQTIFYKTLQRLVLFVVVAMVSTSAYADGPSNQKDYDLVQKNGLALQQVSAASQNDWFIVEAAIKNNGLAFEYAS